jgi:nucleoside-diphosphate-sugar epimerase
MDTWLSFFPIFMKLGLYLMPIGRSHQFNFTHQQDVARVAVALIRQAKVLNGTIDVIEPQAHSLMDVVDIY